LTKTTTKQDYNQKMETEICRTWHRPESSCGKLNLLY